MPLARIQIQIQNRSFIHKDERWYNDQDDVIIEVEECLYKGGTKTKFVVGQFGTLWSIWNYQCRVLTNLNKNKKIIIDDKYRYISITDLIFLTTVEQRKYKINKLMDGVH